MSTANLRRQAIEQRSQARRQLLQGLYQWQIIGDDAKIVKENQMIDARAGEIDHDYFDAAWAYITTNTEQLDCCAADFIRRNMATLDPVEHAILWIGIYELTQRIDIHQNVIINEAVELAKQFGSDDGYKFVNGVLDQCAKRHRAR